MGEALPEPHFIAYIDGAGDPGIKKVAPIDAKVASECFTVGCAVVRAEKESDLVSLVRTIKQSVFSTQKSRPAFPESGRA